MGVWIARFTSVFNLMAHLLKPFNVQWNTKALWFHSPSITATLCRKLKIWIWWICDITVCAKFGILLFSMNRKIWSGIKSFHNTAIVRSMDGWWDLVTFEILKYCKNLSREMLCRDLFNLKLIPNSNYQVSGESWSWKMTNNQIPIKYNTLQF